MPRREPSRQMPAYPSDLAEQIGRLVEGEVRFDRYSRVLYSTDASVWQIEPIGAVIPRHHGDVRELVSLCGRHGVPVLRAEARPACLARRSERPSTSISPSTCAASSRPIWRSAGCASSRVWCRTSLAGT